MSTEPESIKPEIMPALDYSDGEYAYRGTLSDRTDVPLPEVPGYKLVRHAVYPQKVTPIFQHEFTYLRISPATAPLPPAIQTAGR